MENFKLNYSRDKHKVLLTLPHQWSNIELKGIVLIATGEKDIDFILICNISGVCCAVAIRGRTPVFDRMTLR